MSPSVKTAQVQDECKVGVSNNKCDKVTAEQRRQQEKLAHQLMSFFSLRCF